MTRFEVAVDREGQTLAAGFAFTHLRQRVLSSTFTYVDNYLREARAYELEPAMPFRSGPIFHEGLPCSFRDASPDRWGRSLIQKQFLAEQNTTGGLPRHITELDYLLRTSDVTRQGALRFRSETNTGTSFDATGSAVPKLVKLPELLDAARQLTSDTPDTTHDLAAIKTLLDAGTSSLGGARPKASVDDEGSLYMVKFPHPGDRWNVMRWEKIALDLALAGGVTVPENRLLDIDGASVLLLRRFDRNATGQRIGYISALTLLDRSDGKAGDYLEIAEAFAPVAELPAQDLAQLWRRVLVSLLLHNTDDHLRNHGFLRGRTGWRLSPAFDLNPNPELNASRVTSINGAATIDTEREALMGAREWFGLSEGAAHQIVDEVCEALSSWRDIARAQGASDAEIKLFAPVLDRK